MEGGGGGGVYLPSFCVSMRKRERQTDRQTETQTDRQTDRDTDRDLVGKRESAGCERFLSVLVYLFIYLLIYFSLLHS